MVELLAALAAALAGTADTGMPPGARETATLRRVYAAAHATDVTPPTSPGRPGDLVTVPVADRARSPRAVRFLVEVEGGLGVDAAAFAAAVERILADRRGWRGVGRAFTRVAREPVAFRVALAAPPTVDRLCAPLPTNRRYSCASGNRAVLNLDRWRKGSPTYEGRLRSYRIYMVNHEVGHVLGHLHATCPGTGHRAPVMMQQTKGLGGCVANPWPLARER